MPLRTVTLIVAVLLAGLFLLSPVAAVSSPGKASLAIKPEKPVDVKVLREAVSLLRERINLTGISDFRVELEETGEGHLIRIKAEDVTPEEVGAIKRIAESFGRLYIEFNGVVVGRSVNVTGYRLEPKMCPTCWRVDFTVPPEVTARFKEVASGKLGWPTDIYLDPPVNSLLVVSPRVYQEMNSQDFMGEPKKGTPKPLVERLKEAFNITVIEYQNQSAGEIVDNATALGKDKIILADVPEKLYTEVKGTLSSRKINIEVSYYALQTGEGTKNFVKRILNLYGPYVLRFDPAEDSTTRLTISGVGKDRKATLEEAKKLYLDFKMGSLPVTFRVVDVSLSSTPSGTSTSSGTMTAKVADDSKQCGPASIVLLALLPLIRRR
ncbi:CGP-CTERM sorting domain-containing protein [Thermococcus sp. AM4]|uniref:CGP-CTERM sorting domain-containing protein n=1 Tax=Thermococcus sp. (strain AM4) TaxID=246969 RepID=UPI001ED98200|nr:CGP-CTERM sorting domain-containing protein [Thermococcus sp. AM4]